ASQTNKVHVRQSGSFAEMACTGRAAVAAVMVYTTVGNAAGAVATACGSWLASIASGGSSHSWNARSVPNRCRHGLRNAATSSTATVKASSSSQPRPSQSIAASSLVIVELLEQFAQFGDVLLRQLALLGEVRHQRRHPASEQAVEQALALLLHVLLAREQRRIEVAAAVALRVHGLFPQQTVEQGFDRALLPALRRADFREDFLGRAWRLAPQYVHHYCFRFADGHGITVYACNWIHVYTCK